MASNERIRKYLDAGTVLGQVSRGRAEEIVRELVNAGDIQRSQAQEWVDNLVERSHKSSEQVLELVRHEVASQLEKIDPRSLESIANQVAEVLKKSAKAGPQRHQGRDRPRRQSRQGRDQQGGPDRQGRHGPGRKDRQGRDHAGRQDGHPGPRCGHIVAPSRLPGIKPPSGSSKADAKKTHSKKVSEANKSAAKKEAS